MPYTPPAQSSSITPVATTPSPKHTRSYSSGPHKLHTFSDGSRHALPRSLSSSYLTMQRRSPPATKPPAMPLTAISPSGAKGDVIPELDLASEDQHSIQSSSSSSSLSSSSTTRKSTPNTQRLSPSSDSSPGSSDDDSEISGVRGRELKNLAELQAAIRTIEQTKEVSPREANIDCGTGELSVDAFNRQTSHHVQPLGIVTSPLPSPLTREARKISHSRSNTEGSLMLDVARPSSPSTRPLLRTDSSSDEDEVEGFQTSSRPPMLRKKSGELVRPALRPASCQRRPSSMPGTPTYSKAVHFDSHLEHVRHFLQVDKPLAVSAGSSPVETHHHETEFPFGSGGAVSSSHEWQISLPNFQSNASNRQHMPVRVERVFLSSDTTNLVGCVAVHNLAYRKQVTVRFTLDDWKTTSEVNAEYNNNVRHKFTSDGCDRFNFSIRLMDQANLEKKIMFFCVRYDVDGKQFWDNNDSVNYRVEFTRRCKAEPPTSLPTLGTRPLNALPRSKLTPSMSAAAASGSTSGSHSFDDFASTFDSFSSVRPQSHLMLEDSPIKLKRSQPSTKLVPDAPVRKSKASVPAFGNRYDFGASLSAAIQNASNSLGNQNGIRKNGSSVDVDGQTSTKGLSDNCKVASDATFGSEQSNEFRTIDESKSSLQEPPLSDNLTLRSRSYQELVDKYCFVRFPDAAVSRL